MGHRGTLLAGGMPAQFPGGDRTAFISRKGQPGFAPRVSKCDSVAIALVRRARTVGRYIRRTGAIDSVDRLKCYCLQAREQTGNVAVRIMAT